MIEGQVGSPSAFNVTAMMIPLETIGVNYVPMDQNTTEVSLTVGNHTAIADCYTGVAPYLLTTSDTEDFTNATGTYWTNSTGNYFTNATSSATTSEANPSWLNTTGWIGNPLSTSLSGLVGQITGTPGNYPTTSSWARLFIGDSNNNTSLDFFEKGYLVFYLANGDAGVPGEHITVQVRPENSAPMSTDFVVPAQLTTGWMAVQG
jgi:archaellin